MSAPKSNEVLAENIRTIQNDILEIKNKLDTKYVSHETFELTIKNMNTVIAAHEKENNDKFNFALKMAILVGAPIYGAVITLVFKVFTA